MNKCAKFGVENSNKMQLPIGYRFCPTDEELLIHYLKRKMFSFPLPASVISDFNVFLFPPFHLPGDLKEKRYFFSKRNAGYMNKWYTVISLGSFGYWKAIGNTVKLILASGSKQPIGLKKSFVFYQGNNLKTPWIMQEYTLLMPSNSIQAMEVEDWVVYSIHQNKKNKRKAKPRTQEEEEIRPIVIDDLTMEEDSDGLGPPQPCSSTLTIEEVSCYELDQEEECSPFST